MPDGVSGSRIEVSGGSGVAELFLEKRRTPSGSRSGAFISSGGEVKGVPEAASPPLGAAKAGPRLGQVWAPRGSSPSRLLAP